MLATEACAVEKRIEKSKAASGLTSLSCCLFYLRYLLPCRHMFHEHMYGATKLLTTNVWRNFQQMFQECGFEVYTHHEIVKVDTPERTKAERASDNRPLAVNELMKRTRDVYWKIEGNGDENQTNAFIRDLKSHLEPILRYAFLA
ncbi:hypothetical protein C2G38_2030897 [Gigaspora rosea]|uniref:SWIM-type domain-containing protein n=1 Tax=Gigaspora rosea TaxID=44941 RepID=A0A397VWD4_9GLOM|nr:hypothetical protein C2G38_2030897 [Gigaspora rosea]